MTRPASESRAMHQDSARGKVFGVGLSKTGTTTLGACLKRLGYDHFSWNQGFAQRVLRGDVEEALKVARRHDSFDDLPWPAVYKELDEAFPNAKFVLTVRKDPETWFRSMLRHAEYKGATEVRERFYGNAIPHGHRDEHMRVYLQHNEDVVRHFDGRDGKLLVVCWEDDPGWRPLCEFLGHPVLDEPLPHLNKRRDDNIKVLLRRAAFSVRGAVSDLT